MMNKEREFFESYYKEKKITEKENVSVSKEEIVELVKALVKEEISKLKLDQNQVIQDFLNVQEASKYLNLAVTTVYEKTSRKEIPFHKRDKKLYFKKKELEAWLLYKSAGQNDQEPVIRKLPIPKRFKKVA